VSALPAGVTAYAFCKDLPVPPTFHGSRVALWPQYILQRPPEGEEVNEAITTHLPGTQNYAPGVSDNGGQTHIVPTGTDLHYQAEWHIAK